jgi:TolB protein
VVAEPGTEHYQYDGFSSDGRLLAVAWRDKAGEQGAFLLDLETGQRSDLPEFDNAPSFSPDGRYLVGAVRTESGKTDIIELDRETREVRSIAPHEDWEWLPSYSSDGQLILFNSYRTGASDIYTYEPDKGSLAQITVAAAYDAHAQFSPDDSAIAYHRNDGDGDYNVYMRDLRTGDTNRLTAHEKEDAYPSWSPDGRTIVFASDRFQDEGALDLFLLDLQGGDLTQLTDSLFKDAYPFFSPDGKYVYFTSNREQQGIYRIHMEGSGTCTGSVDSESPDP